MIEFLKEKKIVAFALVFQLGIDYLRLSRACANDTHVFASWSISYSESSALLASGWSPNRWAESLRTLGKRFLLCQF